MNKVIDQWKNGGNLEFRIVERREKNKVGNDLGPTYLIEVNPKDAMGNDSWREAHYQMADITISALVGRLISWKCPLDF
jgi:hypothetical protein